MENGWDIRQTDSVNEQVALDCLSFVCKFSRTNVQPCIGTEYCRHQLSAGKHAKRPGSTVLH